MEQFIPSELESYPELGSNLYCGHIFPGFDHLEIATANIGPLGKLLLREVREISQAIDILAKFDAVRFSHPIRMQRSNGTESEAYFALKLTSEVSRSNKVGVTIGSTLGEINLGKAAQLRVKRISPHGRGKPRNRA